MQSEDKTRTYIVTVAEQEQEQLVDQTSELYPTFTEMLTSIDNLKRCWMKKEICLDSLQDRLSGLVNKQNPDYSRLKVYIENRVIENDIDIEKWTAEQIMTVLTIVLSVFAGAIGLQADVIDFLQNGLIAFVVFLLVVAVCCIAFGMYYETRLKKCTKEVNFYKICLNILK